MKENVEELEIEAVKGIKDIQDTKNKVHFQIVPY